MTMILLIKGIGMTKIECDNFGKVMFSLLPLTKLSNKKKKLKLIKNNKSRYLSIEYHFVQYLF